MLLEWLNVLVLPSNAWLSRSEATLKDVKNDGKTEGTLAKHLQNNNDCISLSEYDRENGQFGPFHDWVVCKKTSWKRNTHTHIREGMQYKEKYKSEKASKKWSSMSSWHHHDYRLEYITGEAIFMQDKRNNIACDLFLSLSWLLIHSSAWLDMQCSWHGNFVSFDFLVRSLIVQSHSFAKKVKRCIDDIVYETKSKCVYWSIRLFEKQQRNDTRQQTFASNTTRTRKRKRESMPIFRLQRRILLQMHGNLLLFFLSSSMKLECLCKSFSLRRCKLQIIWHDWDSRERGRQKMLKKRHQSNVITKISQSYHEVRIA